jgi:hypothetical protein
MGQQEAFDSTWKISGKTYADRFQRFYADRVIRWQYHDSDDASLCGAANRPVAPVKGVAPAQR